MTMRITGMSNSGLDIDALVKDTIKPYKVKVQTKQQQEQILEWKQDQFQAIMKKANTFYSKYLDITGSESLYSISAYNQSKFTSSNEAAVTATGSGTASIQNYSVSVTQLATKATGKITNSTLDAMAETEVNAAKGYTASITIGGQAINFTAKVGIANEDANLGAFKDSINAKIQELTDAYSSSTKKADINNSLTALYATIGQDFKRNSDGTATITNNPSYSEDSLKKTMNDISVATDTVITAKASDSTTVITSNVYVKLSGAIDTSATISNYNKATGASSIIAKYSSISGGIVFEARNAGNKMLTINGEDQDGEIGEGKAGTDLSATINNTYGDSYAVTGTSNTKTIDGVTFTFSGVTTSDVKITGSQDVSGTKDRIVDFINDYNDLIGTINSELWEKYDKDYQPLTDDQKSAMSDSQIEKWETKAQTGLLRNDDDLRTLSDSLKNVMSTLIKSSGIDLERMGIKPVDDYKDKNGTFAIDEDKLTAALQSNFENIKDLFMKGYADDTTKDAGIIPKMKELINNNFVKFDSVFNKKAAISGVFALTSELSKQILDMKDTIDDMNDDLIDRENSLYVKYSQMESAMAEAQSQQSQMSSWFSR